MVESVQVVQHAEAPRFFQPWSFRDPSEIPPRRWLYGAHYIRRFVSATSALGGAGKSALALVEAMAMASGKPLLGLSPPSRLRVAYWNGEDPIEEMERRVAAAMLHYGLTAADLSGWLFLGSGREAELVIAHQTQGGAIIARPVVDRVIAELERSHIDLLIIDPFVATHRVLENDNGAIDAVVKQWAAIAEAVDVGVELVHHTRKSSGAELGVEDSRGASAFLNAARSARVLNGMTADEAEKAGIENRRAYFRVDRGKSNLAPPAEGSTWYRFKSELLNNGTHGAAGDSVGVVTSWNWPDVIGGLTGADLLKVQQRLASGNYREDIRARPWAGCAIAEALGWNIDAPGVRERVKGAMRLWLKEGALKTVLRPDETRRERAFIEVGTWAVSA